MRNSALHTTTSSYTDTSTCYPFGMQIQDRSCRNSSMLTYRFGFQGQEGDDEVKGHGNSYTAEFWQYDSRLGRRWNVDPVVKYSQSRYSDLVNCPLIFVDPNGDDFVYSDTLREKRMMKRKVERGKRRSSTYKSMIEDLENSKHTHVMKVCQYEDPTTGEKLSWVTVPEKPNSNEGGGSTMYIDFQSMPKGGDLGKVSLRNRFVIFTGHQIGHMWRVDRGLDNIPKPVSPPLQTKNPIFSLLKDNRYFIPNPDYDAKKGFFNNLN